MRDRRLATALTAWILVVSLSGCSIVEAAFGYDEAPSPTAEPGIEPTAPTEGTPSSSESPSASERPAAASSDPGSPPNPGSPSDPAAPSPSSSPAPSASPAPSPEPVARVTAPASALAFLPGTGAVSLALTASRAYWSSAPVVVVARSADAEALAAAEKAGVPLLVSGEEPLADEEQGEEAPLDLAVVDALHAELARLGTTGVLSLDPRFEAPDGVELLTAADATPERARPETGVEGAALLTDGKAPSQAAAHTARAAGVQVFAARRGDPRASRELIAEFASDAPPQRVAALGDAFGDAAVLTERMRPVRTGAALPNGSQLVFDRTRYVALYGSPLTPALGVLGEQGIKKSVSRARKVAKPYAKLVDEDVVPMFEIIVTVASAGAGKDGNYSNELDPELVRPYVEAARKAGVYVLLDLQPGRTDFLTQAKLYEEFLLEPHVGLALDPEWRLKKHQVHLRQIGSVGIAEVNRVGDYLAELVAQNDLPQKMFVLHQFTSSMIRNRHKLDVSHPELATVIHVDGQGALGSKYGTWDHLRKGAPKGIRWGWKNFYDEDVPMATPKQTVAVRPTPDLITYQ